MPAIADGQPRVSDRRGREIQRQVTVEFLFPSEADIPRILGQSPTLQDRSTATSAREAQALAVCLQCRCSVLIVEAGPPDPKTQMIEILLHRGPAVFDGDGVAEADKGCS